MKLISLASPIVGSEVEENGQWYPIEFFALIEETPVASLALSRAVTRLGMAYITGAGEIRLVLSGKIRRVLAS